MVAKASTIFFYLRISASCHAFSFPSSSAQYCIHHGCKDATSKLFAGKEESASMKTSSSALSRRQLVQNFMSAMTIAGSVLPGCSRAEMTDETNSFAIKGTAYEVPPVEPMKTSTNIDVKSSSAQATATDEVKISIPMSKLQSGSLGVELADVEFRTNRRVYVKSVLPSSIGAQYNIQSNYVLVSINGQSAERTNARGVAQMIGQVKQSNASSLELTFRDDSFQKQLQDLSNSKEATTQVAPAGDTTQRNENGSIRTGFTETSQEDQKITVSQLIPPRICRRGADVDDLLEISYVGTILETGAIFDGSAVKINGGGIPGRGNDVSLFFVLGKQPFGQFPPAWDVGLSGICVGERRRIIIPPVLAYGSTGVPRRNIPPDATLVYDVTLISINGLATP